MQYPLKELQMVFQTLDNQHLQRKHNKTLSEHELFTYNIVSSSSSVFLLLLLTKYTKLGAFRKNKTKQNKTKRKKQTNKQTKNKTKQNKNKNKQKKKKTVLQITERSICIKRIFFTI